MSATTAIAQTYLGPYAGERFDYADPDTAETLGITTGNVRPGGIYEYRYVETSDPDATPENVIGGLESSPSNSPPSARKLIRQAMNRWETASGGTIRWQRCDLKTDDDSFPDCSRDVQGRRVEVVIGVDPLRVAPLGCSLPWKFQHPERLALFQDRRMAFNSANMINEFNVTHELGHCLGLIHEHQRADRAHWLKFRTNEEDALGQGRESTQRAPVIENFSYNSPMAYPGNGGNYRCQSVGSGRGVQGENCTQVGYAPNGTAWSDRSYMMSHVRDPNGRMQIPPEDGSKVKQLHARTHVSKDLFYFNTLADALPIRPAAPGLRQERMLSPQLAGGVVPMGSPALNTKSRGNYNGFLRGSDGNIYWRRYTAESGWAKRWTALTRSGNVTSDPASTSWSANNSVLAFVNRSGAVKFRTSGADGEFVGTAGWQSIGGSLSEAQIPGSQIARTNARSFGGRRSSRGEPPYIGVGLVSRGVSRFDVIAVRRNDHNNGELMINAFDRNTWSGWTPVSFEPDKWSVLQRPSVILNSRGNLLIAATVRNRNTGNCGIMEYEVEMPQHDASLQADSATLGMPSMVSHGFNGRGDVSCATPPAIVQTQSVRLPAQSAVTPESTISPHDHHVFAVNTKGHLIYRNSTWRKTDYREIGGLPKPNTGVAVTNSPMRPSLESHDMLILMNGADFKQKYSFDASAGKLVAPSVQAGGIWFRRWGNIN